MSLILACRGGALMALPLSWWASGAPRALADRATAASTTLPAGACREIGRLHTKGEHGAPLPLRITGLCATPAGTHLVATTLQSAFSTSADMVPPPPGAAPLVSTLQVMPLRPQPLPRATARDAGDPAWLHQIVTRGAAAVTAQRSWLRSVHTAAVAAAAAAAGTLSSRRPATLPPAASAGTAEAAWFRPFAACCRSALALLEAVEPLGEDPDSGQPPAFVALAAALPLALTSLLEGLADAAVGDMQRRQSLAAAAAICALVLRVRKADEVIVRRRDFPSAEKRGSPTLLGISLPLMPPCTLPPCWTRLAAAISPALDTMRGSGSDASASVGSKRSRSERDFTEDTSASSPGLGDGASSLDELRRGCDTSAWTDWTRW